jgi:hypothetical protein
MVYSIISAIQGAKKERSSMRKIVNACLMLILIVSVAGAEPRIVPEHIGLYFDEAGEQSCKDSFAFMGTFPMWLLYVNPQEDAIGSYSVGITLSEPDMVAFLEAQFPCQYISINPLDLEDLNIPCPVLCTDVTFLGQFSFLFLGMEPGEMYFRVHNAASNPVGGDQPVVYLAGDAYRQIQPGSDPWIMICCGVADSKESWGGVKSLYR